MKKIGSLLAKKVSKNGNNCDSLLAGGVVEELFDLLSSDGQGQVQLSFHPPESLLNIHRHVVVCCATF